MNVAENHSSHGRNKSKSVRRVDLKVLPMMDIAGESMDRNTFLELNILGNTSNSSHVLNNNNNNISSVTCGGYGVG